MLPLFLRKLRLQMSSHLFESYSRRRSGNFNPDEERKIK